MMVTDVLLGVLILAVLALLVGVIALWRRIWLLMGSVECLCTNVSRLAERIPERQP
jgi:hypothetical protein